MKKSFKTKSALTSNIFASLIIISFSLISSCKKGDTGPAGTNGTNGSANVQSITVTTNNLSWSLDATDNSFNSTVTVSAITSSVVSNGTVQVFIGDGTSTEWGALPFSYGKIQYNYSYKVGQVILSVTMNDGTVPTNPGGQQYKIVVIPPAARNSNVNTHSYSELKAAYDLKD